MSTTYTIWIVSPEDLVWSHVFDDIAAGLQSAFQELGYFVSVVTDPKKIKGTPIVLGANLCPMYGIALPDKCIIYNFEQVHPQSRWFDKKYGYVELLKKHAVWDYSRMNIERLKAFGVENVVHCAVGYAHALTKTLPAKKDVDVLFIGGDHPRRKKVLDQVAASGVRLHQVYKVFGKERDAWMARGKVHLNVHKEPGRLFEIARVSYLLANGCFVVSEECDDVEMMELFKGGVVFCTYEKLVETCLHYLVRPKECKAIAQKGHELFKAMPQSAFLSKALEEQRAQEVKRMTVKKGGGQQRIFVAIASFRDPQLQPTLNDMFAKAFYPERLRVGICLQVDEEMDEKCMVDADFHSGQVRVKQMHYSESKGANWARARAMELIEDEPYVLLIDSHMRFEPGWDESVLQMLAACPAEKPVLSAYLPGYEPPNKMMRHPENLLRMKVREVGKPDGPTMARITGVFAPVGEEHADTLYPTPFPIVNFIFTRASTLKEVPIDPYITFWGDEINFAARLWTHGYDIFQPNCVVAYHYWVRKDQFHLHDYREYFTPGNKRSLARIRHLLGLKKTKDAAALEDIGCYGLGTARTLESLWTFAGIDWGQGSMTENAEKGLWHMAAGNKESKGMSKSKGKSKKTHISLAGDTKPVKAAKDLRRIFVQIASYRDPECQWTVQDLFEKAAHPERIFVGICWQFVKEEDALCFQIPYPRPDQVRVHEVNAREGKGVCWARGLTQKLWQGEEFTFQIDSHMRFEPGWDEMLLSMWDECGHEKATLTCYPPGYTPPDQLERKWIFGMSAKEFDKNGIFLMRGFPAYEVDKNLPQKVMHGAFASANMLFGPSSMITDVPYDPHLYFFGEEITLAVRLWTHGYELYHPNRLVIYHDWNRNKRPTHFSDHRDWGAQNQRSFARVKHMLGTELSNDPQTIAELDIYGLGKARSLEAYQAYSGVDFKNKTFSENASNAVFASSPSPLGEGGVRNYPRASALKGPHPSPLPRERGKGNGKIFVNIASYRDPECQWTVKDLFEKAANPDRINVGICWQFDMIEDQHCFEVSTRPEQVRVMPVDWRDAEGVCWARLQAQELWEDEEYTLMLDSHMRFVPGWDELMIKELAACESHKPLLSSSPVPYTPPNNLGQPMKPTIRRVKPFFADGNIRCHGEMLDHVPPKPLNGAFVVANFIFSRSEITPEVPYDPYLYFDQEEITYAARLYTHGWDVFSPRQQFLYHFYNDGKAPGGSVRPLHWRDLGKEDEARIQYLRERGLKRFNHMTRYKTSTDPEVIKELDKYGFGTVRTLDQFEQYSGVDFRNKVATEKALRCGFIENLHLYRNRPIRVPELDGNAEPNAPANAEANTRPALAAMLEPGDFLPFIELPDTNLKMRTIETLAGKHTMFFILPSDNEGFLWHFFRELTLQMQQAQLQDVQMIFMLDEIPEKLIEVKSRLGIDYVLSADPDRKIARSLGFAKRGEMLVPAGMVLSRNLKIECRHLHTDPIKLVKATVHDYALEAGRFSDKNRQARIISETAPALIVPNVLSPEMCAKLIHAFRNGLTFDGTIGAEGNRAYRSDIKMRTDYVPYGDLLAEIDDKLSRSFFPEIKKIFGFEVTNRELYKVGLYAGEKQGFFVQHRDNFDNPMGYRRVAATVHLNDDYEGGGLRFPEYDDTVYRPQPGSGIAFSCSTMHEARPVTKGERFVLVCFFHGREDEAYRRQYLEAKGMPLKERDYTPALRKHPELKLSRGFYDKWHDENMRYTVGINAQPTAIQPAKVTGNVMINTMGNHQPQKVFESKEAVIFDNFLPEDVYEKINSFALTTDYERINTHGKAVRAWHIHDGFPLRSSKNVFYYSYNHPQPKPDYVYPSNTPFDMFADNINAIQPQVQHLVGQPGEGGWEHFSVTAWMYPHGTGLSMHDDGSGVYTGAYVYFLNPQWRPHWGGLLLMVDEAGNKRIYEHRAKIDQIDFHNRKWLHANPLDEFIMEHGFAQCIMPKRNRMVFIANNAYHMVTRVNEQSGDNLRMSLAGFFNRKKKK